MIYLITGANRGLGLALTATYLSRPSSTVIATVRDPTHSTSKSLAHLPRGSGSTLIVLEYDAKSEHDAEKLVKVLGHQYHIASLDVVIANAGIATIYSPVAKLPIATLKEHVEVNTYGPLLLFQAVLPLLQAAKEPKFVVMGSVLGSVGGMEQHPFPMAGYGASKAMLHYLVRKIHFENEGLIAFPIDPGFVQTDMGNAGAQFFGMKEATQTVEESTTGTVSAIDNATRETTSGHFASYNGEEFPW